LTFKIKPVETAKDLTSFLSTSLPLYADDPNFRAPLLFERKQQLNPKHPFFQHARWQGWVAWQGDQPVGRISAQVDSLNDAQGRPDLGYFGMFEAKNDPELAQSLFNVAEQWLRAQGKSRVAGPFNLGINQEVGLLVEGFDTPPYFMMGHAHPYYEALITQNGYLPVKDLLAYEMDPGFDAPKIMRSMVSRLKPKLTVRPIDRRKTDEDLRAMCSIFNDAWSSNWGFVPFTEAEFLAVGKEMLLIIPDEFIQIAELEGEPAAFIVMLPNLNDAIADLNGSLLPFGWAKLLWRLKVKYPHTARVPLMGVRKAFQNSMTGAGLAFAVMEAVRWQGVAKGIDRVEMSWILEDNQGMRNILETIGGEISKRYRMFEKVLA
jgi:hypothetical protein